MGRFDMGRVDMEGVDMGGVDTGGVDMGGVGMEGVGMEGVDMGELIWDEHHVITKPSLSTLIPKINFPYYYHCEFNDVDALYDL